MPFFGNVASASTSDEADDSNDYDLSGDLVSDVDGIAKVLGVGAEITSPIPGVEETPTLPLAETLAAARVSFAPNVINNNKTYIRCFLQGICILLMSNHSAWMSSLKYETKSKKKKKEKERVARHDSVCTQPNLQLTNNHAYMHVHARTSIRFQRTR